MNVAPEDLNAADEIQESILEYLEEHPEAADSVDGIRNWWLLRRIARHSLTRVQLALDCLERAALVQRVVLQDGGVLYRRVDPGCGQREETMSTTRRNHDVQ